MAVEFTQEVSSRLQADHYGWLTTVATSGLADAMGDYNTRLKISIDKVWTTPTGG